MIKSDITFNLGANFDDITKALKIFNKSTGQSLSDSIKKGLNAPIADFKKQLEFLKSKSTFAVPKAQIEEMAQRIRDATNAKLELDLKRANEQIWDLRGQIIGIYASFKGLVSKPISASINFNNAMNEINRFSNFSTKELEVFKKDIWSLGKTNGVKLDDIIKTSEISAKLGIAKQDLKSFSQIALDMQVGLGLGIEQSTEIGSKLSKAFSLSTKELRTLLDGTTAMSKSVSVSGQKILEVMSSISSGAKAFGLGAKETSALSASFLSVGLDSSEASSSINKFFTELNNIDNASDGFKRALAKMGLDAEQLKEDIQSNPQEAIKDLFNSMNDLDDEDRFGVISEIFGKKMANNINSAKDGMKAFDKALLSTKDSAGALEKAVDRAAGDGFGDVVMQLGNAFKHLGVSIGNVFVPILKPIFEGIKNITNAFSGLLDNNKWLGIGIAGLVGSFFILKGALLTTKMLFPILNLIIYPLRATYTLLTSGVMGFIWKLRIQDTWNKITTISTYAYKGAMYALNQSYKLASDGVGWFLGKLKSSIQVMRNSIVFTYAQRGAMYALNGAFKIAGIGASLFSKIFKVSMWSIKGVLISTGIGALVVGIGLAIEYAINHWEGIKGGFVAVWEWIKDGISPIVDWFKGIFDFISEGIGGIIDSIKGIGDLIGFGNGDKTINTNATTHLKGSIDEVITKQNENKAKMLSSISNNDNSRQINDYKNITINTNANPESIAKAINSYSYDDDL